MSAIEPDQDVDDDIDETLTERIYGLTEMFPQTVRSVTSSVFNSSLKLVGATYLYGRHTFWIGFTSAVVFFGPVWIEIERGIAARDLQRQLLLGPRI